MNFRVLKFLHRQLIGYGCVMIFAFSCIFLDWSGPETSNCSLCVPLLCAYIFHVRVCERAHKRGNHKVRKKRAVSRLHSRSRMYFSS